MTKDRARANGPAMPRRTLLTALPAATAALTLSPAAAASDPDPVVALYREWLDARRAWRELADLPGNEDWDDPRSLAAEERETLAENRMLETVPTTIEGIGALVALSWAYGQPVSTDPEKYAQEASHIELRALMAAWKACTGLDGYPVT